MSKIKKAIATVRVNVPALVMLAALVVLAPLAVVASDIVPAPPQTQPIALVGATIHTVSGDVIDNGTIVFSEGKITALGSKVTVPSDAQQIDVSGQHVYPGLIAANTSMGLVEIAAVRSTRDYAEVGDVKPNVRAEVSINPDSEVIPVTRANGITMCLSVPLGGLISGTSALIRMDGWTWEDLTVASPVGLHVWWPNMTVGDGPDGKKARERRDEKIAKITAAFANARAYAQAKAAEGDKGVPYHDVDMRWEAMIPVLERQVPVFIHANGIRDIQASVDWASSENLRIVIVGGYDAWRVTDLLKKNDVTVIVADILRMPARRWEDYDAGYVTPLKLYEAGIPFCIATDGGRFNTAHERSLPYHAAMAVAYGLPAEEALKSLTMYPAQILGVADRVGSLEVGKDATLIVTTGDPLEIMSQVTMEFIDGRNVDLRSRHTQLNEKYQARYQQLGAPDATAGK